MNGIIAAIVAGAIGVALLWACGGGALWPPQRCAEFCAARGGVDHAVGAICACRDGVEVDLEARGSAA